MAAEPIEPDSEGASSVVFDCSKYVLSPAGITVNTLGTVFKARFGPISEAEVAALEHAALSGMVVRLTFSAESGVLLSRIKVERIAIGWVWIEGPIQE